MLVLKLLTSSSDLFYLWFWRLYQYKDKSGWGFPEVTRFIAQYGKTDKEIKRLLKGQENNKVLMYCTGGIRCEKASSYLINHGFIRLISKILRFKETIIRILITK